MKDVGVKRLWGKPKDSPNYGRKKNPTERKNATKRKKIHYGEKEFLVLKNLYPREKKRLRTKRRDRGDLKKKKINQRGRGKRKNTSESKSGPPYT